FEEIPAVFADDPHDRTSLAAAMAYLTHRVTDASAAKPLLLAPEPIADEKVRKEIVRWYLRPPPQTDALQLAEQIYGSFDDSGKAAMKRILLRLVAISPNANPTARTAAWTEIAERDAWMIETLAERRLLSLRGQGTARDVRLTDPAVVEHWQTLRDWVDQEKAF